ncbi:MAG: ATP-binding protein [Fusobacteriaceae bacterium]|nr:ATP-binding protein [Fusobacteriaceae bacterium]MBN2838726.1 ATP-binding protein [Fusobacteriaceae bacterium]
MYKEESYYKSDYSEVKKLREKVEILAINFGFLNIYKENIEVSIGEIFTNVIKHGQNKVKNDVKVIIEIDEEKFQIIFEYLGEIPSKERIEEVNHIKEVKDIFELKESGRGIYMVNRLMDSLEFTRVEEISKIKITKKLQFF